MASLVFRLDERAANKTSAQVRLRISHRHTTAWVSTGVYVEPADFDSSDMHHPIHKRADGASNKNAMLSDILKRYDDAIFDLMRSGEIDSLSACDIKERVQGRTRTRRMCVIENPVLRSRKDDSDLLDWFERYGECRRTENTRRHYAYVGRLIHEYYHSRGLRTIRLSELDLFTLRDMADWCRRSGRGECTRYKMESYIRAAYKDAQRCKMVDRCYDPYLDYRIEHLPEREEVEVLSVSDIRRLMSIDLSEQQGVDSLERTRDILLMSFYLCGANLIDLYNLGLQDSDSEVSFIRHKLEGKTLRPVRIYVEPELSVLIDRYRGKNRLLSFGERYTNYYTFQRKVNERCERLSKLVGFKVNMELIRRSWATIAGELEIPDRVIDKSMGHKDATVKDKHYERYDWDRTRRANRQVIDHIHSGVVPNSIKVPKIFRKAS